MRAKKEGRKRVGHHHQGRTGREGGSSAGWLSWRPCNNVMCVRWERRGREKSCRAKISTETDGEREKIGHLERVWGHHPSRERKAGRARLKWVVSAKKTWEERHERRSLVSDRLLCRSGASSSDCAHDSTKRTIFLRNKSQGTGDTCALFFQVSVSSNLRNTACLSSRSSSSFHPYSCDKFVFDDQENNSYAQALSYPAGVVAFFVCFVDCERTERGRGDKKGIV